MHTGLLPSDLAASLEDLRVRRPDLSLDVRWFPSVGSTMDVAARLLAGGSAPGLVVVADEQTAGRGRRGNTWASPPRAGVYLSLVLRPSARAIASSLLTLAAGVGVREGIEAASGLSADLKWPNDLVVGRRKLGGILAEGMGLGLPGAAVVVGVGINLGAARFPSDVAARATSIEAETGRAVTRGRVVTEVLAGVMDRVERLEHDAGDILRAWRAAAPSAVGTLVEWTRAGGRAHGVTAGIDDAGALLVETPSGTERMIAGEVRWPTFDAEAGFDGPMV